MRAHGGRSAQGAHAFSSKQFAMGYPMPETIDDRRALALRAADVEVLEVMGRRIVVIRDETGRKWIVVRRACEALGVDYSSQRAKLRSEGSTLTVAMIATVDPGGIMRPTLCLDADHFPAWVAGINHAKVDPSLRPQIEEFKRQVVAVIRDAFIPVALRNDQSQSGTLAPRVDLDALANVVVDKLSARFETRFDALESKTDRAIQAATAASEQAIKAQASRISQPELLELRVLLGKVVNVRRGLQPTSKRNSLFREEYNLLGQHVGWGGNGQAWASLPRDRAAVAIGYLEKRLKDVQKQFAAAPSSQASLFGGAL